MEGVEENFSTHSLIKYERTSDVGKNFVLVLIT